MKNIIQHATLFDFHFYWSPWGSSWDLPSKLKRKGYIKLECSDSRNPKTSFYSGLPEDKFGLHYLISYAIKEIVGDVAPTIEMVKEFNNLYKQIYRGYKTKTNISFLKKLPLGFYSEEDLTSDDVNVRGFVKGLEPFTKKDSYGYYSEVPIGGWCLYIRFNDYPKSESNRIIVKAGDKFILQPKKDFIFYSDKPINFRIKFNNQTYEALLYKAANFRAIIESPEIEFI